MQVAFKAKGTELLKAQKYIEAIDKYTQALNIMNERINRNEIKTQQQMFELIENIKLPCLKNISLCYMKLKQYADCIITCDLILEIDSECQKTFYRKAFCFIELEQFKDADGPLTHAETINPSSKQIKLLRQKWAERKESLKLLKEEKQKEQQKRKEAGLKAKTGLVETIVNFIFYWVMLPLRWSQYVFSFLKKAAKEGYAKVSDYKILILHAVVNLVSSVFNSFKRFFRSLKQGIVSKTNRIVRTFVGPFNRLVKRYLNINIPLYLWLSGENSPKIINEPIASRYESN